MIPGVGKQLKDLDLDERELKRVEAIIQSMTPGERRDPRILNGKRKRRVSKGSGRSPQEINELLRSFEQMRGMMKQLSGMSGMGRMKAARQLMGGGGADMMDMAAQLEALGGGDFAGVGAGAGAGGPRRNKKVPPRKKKRR